MRKLNLISILLCLCFFLNAEENRDSLLLEEGKHLFRNHCKACHNIDRILVGPALKGVTERRDSLWIYSFIKNSQSMIKQGDSTAIALYAEYNEVMMPNQKLADSEIDAILNYIEHNDKGNAKNLITRPEKEAQSYSEMLAFSNYVFWIPFTLMLGLLVVVLYQMTFYFELVDEQN